MSNTTEQNNQPAFPLQYDPYVDHPAHGRVHRSAIGEEVQSGMTLRDYFAAKAMIPLITYFKPRDNEDFREIAENSYDIADAMLKAREQQNK